jgi:hypothetical protein
MSGFQIEGLDQVAIAFHDMAAPRECAVVLRLQRRCEA